MDVGPVDSSVATGRPTGAVTNQVGMIDLADIEVADATSTWSLDLGMAFEAEIGIPLDEHLGVDRTMRVMADGATFAHGLMFENKATGLIPMTSRAVLVQAGHGQTAGGLHDIHPVGIVTLHTVHLPFQDRMMLGQMERGLYFEMTGKTGFRVVAWVHDKPASPTADGDVFAGGPVA
ncbi:MAG: hypothetical protein JWR69_2247 [Pedosphaera sp.]|nr:hypothetical protein [Pedosphaera sp.]